MEDGIGLDRFDGVENVVILFRMAKNEFRSGIHGGTMSFRQVIIDGDLVIRFEQLLDACRPNITRPARYQYIHEKKLV